MDRFEAFSVSLLELNRSLQKIKDLEAKRYGLRAGHVMCLYHLGRSSDGLTVSQLADSCHEDKAAISRCVKELMEKELVAGNPAGRTYRARLLLTDAGQDMARTIDQRVEAALASVGSTLNQTQREHFYTAMETIQNDLANYLAAQETIDK